MITRFPRRAFASALSFYDHPHSNTPPSSFNHTASIDSSTGNSSRAFALIYLLIHSQMEKSMKQSLKRKKKTKKINKENYNSIILYCFLCSPLLYSLFYLVSLIFFCSFFDLVLLSFLLSSCIRHYFHSDHLLTASSRRPGGLTVIGRPTSSRRLGRKNNDQSRSSSRNLSAESEPTGGRRRTDLAKPNRDRHLPSGQTGLGSGGGLGVDERIRDLGRPAGKMSVRGLRG